MMKRIATLLIIIGLISFPVFSQTEKKGSFLTRGFEWVKGYLDKSALAGLDTNYVGLPKYGFLGSVSANLAGINTTVTGHGILNFGDLKINMKSILRGQTTLSFGYRGLLIKYTRDLFNAYNSDLAFSWFDRAWGVEFRRHSTDGLHGKITVPALDEPIQVAKGDIKVKTTLIDAYLILSSKKFSYYAAMYPALIQKRSAGSFLIAGSYINSSLINVAPTFIKKLDDVKEIDVVQGAIGFGYGYNYAINGGRILLHLSAVPMIVIHNNNILTWDYEALQEDGTTETMEILERIGASRQISLTGIVRCSANYNISDRFMLRFDGKVNNIRFHSNSGLTVQSADWLCSLMFGVRF